MVCIPFSSGPCFVRTLHHDPSAWVVLPRMDHSLIELDKAVVHVIMFIEAHLTVVSDSVRPHRWQPTRLCCPWDSPGKNTGVGCHFLLQCMKVKSQSEVALSCPTLRNPMDWSLPGSSIHGIFQARCVLFVVFPLLLLIFVLCV